MINKQRLQAVYCSVSKGRLQAIDLRFVYCVSDLHCFKIKERDKYVLSFGHLPSFNIIRRICQDVTFSKSPATRLPARRLDLQRHDSTRFESIQVKSSAFTNSLSHFAVLVYFLWDFISPNKILFCLIILLVRVTGL